MREERTIHKILGSSNILVIVPDGYQPVQAEQPQYLSDLLQVFTSRLKGYAVINSRYKRDIMNFSDVRAISQRPKIADAFLQPILQFKNEIAANNLLPLVLIIAVRHAEDGQEVITLGYGQGERGSALHPHHPTLNPSALSSIRLALEDQQLSSTLAQPGSAWCGNEPHHINQIFRRKGHLDGFLDPSVRSLLITLHPDIVRDREKAIRNGESLAVAFRHLCREMALVRLVEMNTIDTSTPEDLQYIFRLQENDNPADLLRESYIEELAASIEHNGLLHPLVLLQKVDGRYRILCGFRRFQAMKRLHRQQVEAKVYEDANFSTEDFFSISLAENTRRRNLNPLEIGNFLESASKEMGLNNAELAERFGGTLGIGKPGQQVSQSTVHKYRKVHQLRLRNESPEILADVINERLQFSIAAELLAPIKDPLDRDSLYLQIIKPLAPTRPQLTSIIEHLCTLAPHLREAIALPLVQQALAEALPSPHQATTFLNLLTRRRHAHRPIRNTTFDNQLKTLRRSIFGGKATKRDFNLTLASPDSPDEVIVQFKLKRGNTEKTLDNVRKALDQIELFGKGEM